MEHVYEHNMEDCPVCVEGVGSIEHENGWCVYVECLDCGAHTAHFSYNNEDEKIAAEKSVVHLWNAGKVVSQNPNE